MSFSAPGNILTSHQYKRVFPQDWELRFALAAADIMCIQYYSVAATEHTAIWQDFSELRGNYVTTSQHVFVSAIYPTHYKFGKIWVSSDSELMSGRAELILDITPENMYGKRLDQRGMLYIVVLLNQIGLES